MLMVIDARRLAREICASNGGPKLDTEDAEKDFVQVTAIWAKQPPKSELPDQAHGHLPGNDEDAHGPVLLPDRAARVPSWLLDEWHAPANRSGVAKVYPRCGA